MKAKMARELPTTKNWNTPAYSAGQVMKNRYPSAYMVAAGRGYFPYISKNGRTPILIHRDGQHGWDPHIATSDSRRIIVDGSLTRVGMPIAWGQSACRRSSPLAIMTMRSSDQDMHLIPGSRTVILPESGH
jgi:hypothetical protein